MCFWVSDPNMGAFLLLLRICSLQHKKKSLMKVGVFRHSHMNICRLCHTLQLYCVAMLLACSFVNTSLEVAAAVVVVVYWFQHHGWLVALWFGVKKISLETTQKQSLSSISCFSDTWLVLPQVFTLLQFYTGLCLLQNKGHDFLIHCIFSHGRTTANSVIYCMWTLLINLMILVINFSKERHYLMWLLEPVPFSTVNAQ